MILRAATQETRMHVRCVQKQIAAGNKLERLADAAGEWLEYERINSQREGDAIESELRVAIEQRKVEREAAKEATLKRRAEGKAFNAFIKGKSAHDLCWGIPDAAAAAACLRQGIPVTCTWAVGGLCPPPPVCLRVAHQAASSGSISSANVAANLQIWQSDPTSFASTC